MKKRMWTGRVLAFGAALAFMAAAGVGVQAREPESLTEVTEISASAFQALKPEGPATAEEKHEVIGNILLEAGVPEFMVEKLDDGMIESLYASPGFETQVEYFKEDLNGDLKQIPYEQHIRISEYNRSLQKKNERFSHPASIMSRAQNKIETGAVSGEISNLAQLLIVGMPQTNQRRYCVALAGWEYSPITRADDFIGIYSAHATVVPDTAKAALEYTKNYYVKGIKSDESEDFLYDKSKFIDNSTGMGKEIRLPADYYNYNVVTGNQESYRIENLVLVINVELIPIDPTTTQNFTVLSTYYHEALEIGGSVEISNSGIGFTASPSLVYSRSDVSVYIEHTP